MADCHVASHMALLILADRDMTPGSGEWRLVTDRAKAMWEELGVASIVYCLARQPGPNGYVSPPTDGMETRLFNCPSLFHLPGALMRMAFSVRGLLRTLRPVAVMLSGPFSYLFADSVCRRRHVLIVDLHGVLEEWLEYPPEHVRPKWLLRSMYRVAKMMERHAVRKSAVTLVVTEQFRDYVRREYRHERVIALPCGMQSHALNYEDYCALRRQWRKRFGLEQELCMVYSGGLSKWQMLDKVCALYKMVERVRPDSRLVLATPDNTEARGIAEAAGLSPDKVVCVTLSPSEAIDALAACDIGLLPRESNLTNAVAFPNKFVEYIRSSLIVITSPGLVEPHRIITQNRIGVCIDPGIMNGHEPCDIVAYDLMRLVAERERDMHVFHRKCQLVLDSILNTSEYMNALRGVLLQPCRER